MKEKINIPSFFTDSETVWVSENFQNIFLSKYAHSGDDRKNQSLDFSDLQDMSHEDNTQALVFQDADLFLEQLARLIHDQMHGEEGKLLNDSSANYFFLKGKDGKSYSILVRWEQAQKLWRCGAYLQEEVKVPSVRIFYPS
jgi:hypothetical protein